MKKLLFRDTLIATTIIVLLFLFYDLSKFINLLIDDLAFFDEYDFVDSLLVAISITVLLLLLFKKLKYYNKSKKINTKLNDEIESLISGTSSSNTEELQQIKQKLALLRKEKGNMSKEVYLEKLIALIDNLVKM